MNVEALLYDKGGRIVTIRMEETIAVACRLLRRENVSALVIQDVCPTEGHTTTGLFTERDVVSAVAEHGAKALQMPVSRLMTRNLVYCRPQDSLDEAAAIMDEHKVRHLPVLDDWHLIGIISMRDVLGARTRGWHQVPANGTAPAWQNTTN